MTARFGKALTRKQQCELLRAQLEAERSSFVSQWRDLADFILPGAYRATATEQNRGDRRNLKIVDSTATFSARTLSAGMMSGVTSPARPWFRLTTPDPDLAEDPLVQDWLHTVTQRMSSIFIRSNAYNALPTLYLDLGTFGTSGMLLEEDDEDVIRCTPLVLGTYLIAADARGRIRVMVRVFPMSVRQLVDKFGGDGAEPDWSKFSESIQAAWTRGDIDKQTSDVVHVVVPNPDANPDRIDSKFKPFLSVYYELASGDKILDERGYNEFPALFPRWQVRGQDVYGTDSPGMTAIGDVKQLQLGEKKGMQAIEKQINPPMKGNAMMMNVAASLLPGGTTFAAGAESFTPAHEVNFRLDFLENKQAQVRMRTQRAYYEDLFLMLARTDGLRGAQPITAREIEERHEEKLLALGPVLEQLNQDLLDPLIDRTFNIMVRQGLIPPAPEKLADVPLRVEYISIMAQAQKSVALAGIDRFLDRLAILAQTRPDVLDKVDLDQAIDEYASATGIPPRMIIADERVAELRAARAQAEQAAMQAETMKTAAQGAQALSQTDMSGENGLTALLGAGGLL